MALVRILWIVSMCHGSYRMLLADDAVSCEDVDAVQHQAEAHIDQAGMPGMDLGTTAKGRAGILHAVLAKGSFEVLSIRSAYTPMEQQAAVYKFNNKHSNVDHTIFQTFRRVERIGQTETVQWTILHVKSSYYHAALHKMSLKYIEQLVMESRLPSHVTYPVLQHVLANEILKQMVAFRLNPYA
ncbi:hypothetical protein GQ53DRAFT_819043 [Thozetella sp. PMI_491]|nr:hypothetical protein GQ53DRAFT_819043 [Thozetella sp. PMI_491]